MTEQKKRKYYDEKKAEYHRKLQEPEVWRGWTSGQWLDYYRNKFFSIVPVVKYDQMTSSQRNAHISLFKNLVLYFIGSEESSFDLTKGLRFTGQTGTGKTALLKTFAENPSNPFVMKSTIEIVDSWKGKDGGDGFFEKYSGKLTAPSNNFGIKERTYCFDDFGVEPLDAKRYGESRNVMADIVQMLYLKGIIFHVSDNLTSDQVRQYYGDRVESRFSEMFNEIQFKDFPDFRRL